MNQCNDCVHFPICDRAGLLDNDEYCMNRIPAQEVKGHWIKPFFRSEKTYIRMCSECGNEVYFCGSGNYPYCPYCKANMKGDNNV